VLLSTGAGSIRPDFSPGYRCTEALMACTHHLNKKSVNIYFRRKDSRNALEGVSKAIRK
jgi:hypothetical protein